MAKYTGPEFASCERCSEPAGQFVHFHSDGHGEALCFTHWHPIRSTCKVDFWINKYGRPMFAKGATTGPFNVKHP